MILAREREALPVTVRRVLLVLIVLVIAGSATYRASTAGVTFFMDEIWVVEMVRDGVYAPGAVPQPPLFFFSAVAASRTCGFSERCLRVPSQVAAILLTCVPLIALRWTRRLLDERGALVWTLLLAFSSPIVFYAARIKQYPTEALGSATIIAAFLAVLAEPVSRARWRTYFVLCAVLVPLLHSAALVIAGTGLGLTWLAARRDKRAATRVLLAHAALAAMFVLAYVAYMRPGPEVTSRFGDLYDYFRDNPEPVFFDGSWRFVISRTAHWAGQLFNLTRGLLAAIALGLTIWCITLVRRRDLTLLSIVLACAVPPVLILIASARELYPYGEVRLMIFAAPPLFLLVALMLQYASDRRVASVAWAAALIFATMLVAREVRHQPYNSTYMGARDLHRMYAYLAHQRRDLPLVTRKSEALPLGLYRPELRVISIEDRAAVATWPSGEFVTMLAKDDPIAPAQGEVLFEDDGLLLRRHRGVAAQNGRK